MDLLAAYGIVRDPITAEESGDTVHGSGLVQIEGVLSVLGPPAKLRASATAPIEVTPTIPYSSAPIVLLL